MQDRQAETRLDQERQVRRVWDAEATPLGGENRCPCGYPYSVCWRCDAPEGQEVKGDQ